MNIQLTIERGSAPIFYFYELTTIVIGGNPINMSSVAKAGDTNGSFVIGESLYVAINSFVIWAM